MPASSHLRNQLQTIAFPEIEVSLWYSKDKKPFSNHLGNQGEFMRNSLILAMLAVALFAGCGGGIRLRSWPYSTGHLSDVFSRAPGYDCGGRNGQCLRSCDE